MTDKNDFKKIIISTFSRFSYQILSLLIVFLLTPFMIKKLGDYQYGLWVLVSIFVNYMGYTELGITSAIERNLAVAFGDKNYKDANEIFNTGLFLNMLIFFLITVITFIIILVINFIHFKQYHLISILIAIMGFNLALTFPFKSFSSIISANIRFEIISGIMLFQVIANSILTVILLSKGLGLIGLALCSLITTFLSNCLYLFFAKRISSQIKFQYSLVSKSIVKKLLNYSSKTFLIQMADILRFKSDEIVTGTFISINMVTTYSIANKLNSAANSFCLSFLGVLNPFF